MDVYMDTERVQQIANGFETFAQIWEMVGSVLEAAMDTLNDTAFVGRVGGAAVEAYIQGMKPKINTLAEHCREISNDISLAITKYKDTAADISGRFCN